MANAQQAGEHHIASAEAKEGEGEGDDEGIATNFGVYSADEVLRTGKMIQKMDKDKHIKEKMQEKKNEEEKMQDSTEKNDIEIAMNE